MEETNPSLRLNTPPFWLDRWFVDPPRNRIQREDELRRLEPKTMEVLIFLAQRSGQVVTRDELLDTIWKDTFVSENTLSRTISRLRKALGEDWKNPRYLETVSKSGYRLRATVGTTPPGDVPSPKSRALPQGRSQQTTPRVAIAGVLLLVLSGWLWFLPADSQVPRPEFRPVVTLLGQQRAPALSPDGSHLAFGWGGPADDNLDVYVQSLGAENPVRLTTSTDFEGYPVFSADGGAVVFAKGDPQGCKGFFRMSTTGDNAERIADCPNSIQDLAWSPDQSMLAFSEQPDQTTPRRILLLDLKTQKRRQLTSPPPASLGDRDPMFSPDGQQIAFRRRQTRGRHNLFRVSLSDETLQPITSQPWGLITGHDWARGGQHLIFATDHGGTMDLYRIGIGGGLAERLPTPDLWPTWPRLSRSSDHLIYRRIVDVTDLWTLQLDESRRVVGEPIRVAASTRSEMHPNFSMATGKVAFTSNRSGPFEVWSGNLDGTELIRHSRFRGPSVQAPQWSPDGKWLLFDAYDLGHADVFRVASGSRNPSRLISSPADERNAFYSRDSEWIYFASNRTGEWQIWKMPSQGGESIQVTQRGAFRAQEGSDGTSLYYIKLDGTGVWELVLASGVERQILDKIGRWEWGNWAVRESGIYFVQRAPTAIAHYDFKTGRIEALTKLPKTVQYLTPSFWVAEDESRILYTQIGQSDDELILVENLGY